MARSGRMSVSTMPKPEKMAPATKYGGKMVVCQPGHERHREVEGDDRVDGEDERGRDAGQDQVRHLVVAPVAARAAPAHGEEPVDPGPERLADRGEPVAHGRQVGDHAHVPEEHRDRAVGRDREHVPLERRAEVLPDVVRVRQREEEPGVPHAADVEHREDARADDGEDRHGLGRAVDRGAPLLAQEAQDRRDERPGVADADPEDEVDDVPRPVDRVAVAPDADAGRDQVDDARRP